MIYGKTYTNTFMISVDGDSCTSNSVESTALRLITGLGSSEVQPQLSRFNAEPKQVNNNHQTLKRSFTWDHIEVSSFMKRQFSCGGYIFVSQLIYAA